MDLFCTEDFYTTYNSLIRQKAYRGLEEEMCNYFIDKNIEDLLSGTRLNNSNTRPLIKKRISGSGGYRIYYLLQISDSIALLLFIHPKTGPDGGENITDEHYKKISKDAIEALKNKTYWAVSKVEDSYKLSFKKVEKIEVEIKVKNE